MQETCSDVLSDRKMWTAPVGFVTPEKRNIKDKLLNELICNLEYDSINSDNCLF